MNIFSLLRTLLSRFLLILIIIFLAVPFCIIALIPQKIRVKSKIVYAIIQSFYYLCLKAIFIPINYRGLENIPSESAIFVANHQSSLDIPLVGRLMGWKPHMWFARSELLESTLLRIFIPVFAVIVDVNSAQKAAQSLVRIIKIVRHTKGSLVIFPEGSRYSDGEIHDFFGGFVTLAKKLNRPVVPIRIFGAHIVYPIGASVIQWHPITILVGKPMTMEHSESEDVFKERVRQWFIDQKEA